MLSVTQAQQQIADEVRAVRLDLSQSVPLGEALGRMLVQDIVSDIDSPPHDKSIVDGYAVVAEGLAAGAELAILEEVTAGVVPTREVTPRAATRIMTGAPLPPGATGVVMVERTQLLEGEPAKVRILEAPRGGQNIARQGTSLKRGAIVLRAGQRINPARIGLLAEVGRTDVQVALLPSVAILTTGNEIVPASAVPRPGQIRNSNGPMLEALVRQLGAAPVSLGVALDDRAELSSLIRRGLAANFLVLSGGVSAGVLDLVPGVLAEMGVRQVFHKVSVKPGKPIWFGVFPKENGAKTLVFGLPGNPVSTFVCFHLFVRHALSCLSPDFGVESKTARLAAEHFQRGERATYWPAMLEAKEEEKVVTPLPWKGSGDLKTLADANCLALFPGEERLFAAGEIVGVYLL